MLSRAPLYARVLGAWTMQEMPPPPPPPIFGQMV